MISTGARRSVEQLPARAPAIHRVVVPRLADRRRARRRDSARPDSRRRARGGSASSRRLPNSPSDSSSKPCARLRRARSMPALLPELRCHERRALISVINSRTAKYAATSSNSESDRRHLDQSTGEAQRDVARIGEQQLASSAPRISAAAMYRPPLIAAISFRTRGARASAAQRSRRSGDVRQLRDRCRWARAPGSRSSSACAVGLERSKNSPSH